jgi:hypothetical protein
LGLARREPPIGFEAVDGAFDLEQQVDAPDGFERDGPRSRRAFGFGPCVWRSRGWKGAGAWPIFSQSRQVNFSRTCWITFHCRGITSSVSVMSSPRFVSRVPPQQAQALVPGTITRSRGRCSGSGLREGRLRLKAATLVVSAAAFSAASSSSLAELSSSSSCNSS